MKRYFRCEPNVLGSSKSSRREITFGRVKLVRACVQLPPQIQKWVADCVHFSAQLLAFSIVQRNVHKQVFEKHGIAFVARLGLVGR